MLRSLLRKGLVVAVLWAGLPTAAVYVHSLALPDRAGRFEKRAQVVSQEVVQRAAASELRDIDNRHETDIGPLFGKGRPEPRQWFALGPTSGAPAPVVFLLHGAGQDGRDMLALWQDVSDRHGITIVAPEARAARWNLLSEGPFYFAAILDDLRRVHPVDANHIYVFGQDDGGRHAIRIANLGAGPFRAVASHAGYPNRFRMVPSLNPVSVYGFADAADEDGAADGLRAALRHLARAGHNTRLTLVSKADQQGDGLGAGLAPVVWEALSSDVSRASATYAATGAAPKPRNSAERRGAIGAKFIRVAPSN